MVVPMEVEPGLRGVMRFDEPMSRHTTWRVGGPAERYYEPADSDDLLTFLRQLPAGEPLFWLGLGSNLLVRDGGIRGTVIATQGALDGLNQINASTLRAEAGVTCAKLARAAARAGLTGGEFFAGIPGTVGGALAMNAGAFGGETWRQVVAVETVDRHGVVRTRTADDFRIGYRSVSGPAGEWYLAARLRFEHGDIDAAQARIKALLAQRNRTQPTSQPSCGSVFRNPPGDHAARLIEAAGLKGLSVGGAQVSEKHANFIINAGNASAADIETLIARVAAEIKRVHGVDLVREALIVGETGEAQA